MVVESGTQSQQPQRFVRVWGYTFMLVFMFAVPGLRQFTDEFNRTMWALSIQAVILHLGLIALVAALLAPVWMAAVRLTRDRPRGRRVLRCLLYAGLTGSVAAILLIKLAVSLKGADVVWPHNWLVKDHGADWATGAIAALAAAVLYALPRLLEIAARLSRLAAKLFSPLPVILLITFATYPQHRLEYQDPPPETTATDKPAPVLLIVMDCLDRARSVDDPAVMARLPHMTAFVAGASQFTQTSTPSQETIKSMPAILHQNPAVRWADPVTCLVTQDGKEVPVSEVPTWFDLVGRAGDTRVMLGFHLDYSSIIGGRVDWLRTGGSFYASPAESPLWTLRSHLNLYAGPTRVPLITR